MIGVSHTTRTLLLTHTTQDLLCGLLITHTTHNTLESDTSQVSKLKQSHGSGFLLTALALNGLKEWSRTKVASIMPKLNDEELKKAILEVQQAAKDYKFIVVGHETGERRLLPVEFIESFMKRTRRRLVIQKPAVEYFAAGDAFKEPEIMMPMRVVDLNELD